MYAADVCANVYRANLLTDIVSKVMAELFYRLLDTDLTKTILIDISGNVIKLYRVTGVQSVVMNEFSRACFLLSCKTTRTFQL